MIIYKDDAERQAYEQGRRAGMAAMMSHENPYSADNTRAAWLDGYASTRLPSDPKIAQPAVAS